MKSAECNGGFQPASWRLKDGRLAFPTMRGVALIDPANLVTVGGQQYLRSYVSDTRSAPELITQAGVLAGVKAYELPDAV